MKTIRITLILLCAIFFYGFVTSGHAFPIAQVLPFCDGEPVGPYHWAGLVMIGIFIWGLNRNKHNRDDDDD